MKKFNKLLKNKPKEATPSSSAPSAASTNDARAQYYASRNVGGNPFDSPRGGGAGGSLGSGGGAAKGGAGAGGANPFADSDSDDDPLAGFARKKSPPQPTASQPTMSSSSGVGGSSGGGGVDKASNRTFDKTSNPFDDEGNNPFDPPSAASAKPVSAKGSNPFEESPPKSRPASRPVSATKNSNPFDSPSRSVPKKAENSTGNPFDSPTKQPTGTTTAVRRNDKPPKSTARPAVPAASVQRGTESPGKGNLSSSGGNLNSGSSGGNLKTSSHGSSDNLNSSLNNSGNFNSTFNNSSGNIGSSFNNSATNIASGNISGSNSNTDKRRWFAKDPRAGAGDSESTRPILSAMDDETVVSPQQLHNKGNALAGWLRLNKKEDERVIGQLGQLQGHGRYGHGKGPSKQGQYGPGKQQGHGKRGSGKKKPRKKCQITAWPFDNFHEVQQSAADYEELASRAASDYNRSTTGASEYNKSGASGEYKSGEYDYNSHDEDSDDYEYNEYDPPTASQYERPEELPSIKEAVNNLPLVDFEKKAQERAINIVSSWLFDAGLIDELLVNGGVPPGSTHGSSSGAGGAGGVAGGGSSNASIGSSSIRTSEGVEIGQHGFPLYEAEKMDKETNKLRTMISRDLSIINARLNDGVAASGLEVQELVNAVSATKEDIGRLRELTTYISDSQVSDRDEFLLATYPHLKRAINARRNINRCFRELEFFSQIPSTCDRLRDELHGGEWTEEEWDTIRNVAMEHVELEILLVEAESSMKSEKNFNNATVDNFLDSHVDNVWELGDEIRMRMLSGIGSAFDLAIQNPAGMVALVEAVEVYEKAAERFEKKRVEGGGGEVVGKLRFTNMRAAALEQLYQDFELRGVEMFRGVHEQAADVADEEDQSNTQFIAVLKAATELVTEIDIVKHQMTPCFAPHWHIEALWSSCVAHVCSNHIVQQIGGPDGQNLPELTITQLLELVAWVEYFRETIEETFPEVAEKRDTKKTYFEERPDLFAGDKRTVNMTNATDSLAWVNNMLWEVHRLAQEEFLVRTRSQTDEWLEKVYGSETVKNQSAEGKLTTSLCEDVFSFSSVQLRTIRERLSKKSDALILAVCVILSHMRSKQVHSRNNFLQDLETCCAASNDFTRMSEKCEDVCTEIISACEFSDDMIATVEASSNELMTVYSSDAVYAARSVHIYVFDPIEEEIGKRLFEQAWEEELVGNDLALSLIRTLEDFHDDLVHFMDDFMVVKSVMSLMSATVIFYVKCLLTRAERHRNNKKPYFGDVQTALNRMTGDIKVMREYFEGLVPKMPALKKNIEKDFEILSTVHELMSIAAQLSISEAEDFILVLQKRVRDVSITKHIVGDLWHLVAPTDERYVWELVESMEEQLVAIAPADEALSLEVNDRSYVKGLRLDEMAVKLYVSSKRNRPVKSTATEKIIHNWRTTWAVRAEEGNADDNKDNIV